MEHLNRLKLVSDGWADERTPAASMPLPIETTLADAASRAVDRVSGSPLRLQAALIAVFALIVGAAGLFQMPPIDRDEARFVQATAQMLETGDFIAIKFQDEERNKKPAGIHWLQAASVAAVSNVEARAVWAYRLPSMAGIAIAAVFTFLIGAQLFGARAGLVAGLLLAASPIAAAEATFAKTDGMLLACVTVALWAIATILHNRYNDNPSVNRQNRFASWGVPAALWLAVGAGVLIKGPIILLIVAPTIATLAIVKRDLGLVGAIRPLTGLAILIAMAAPWALAINVATEGRFFADAVGRDLLGKVGSAQERHWGPPGYHLLLVWALFWPASPILFEGARKTFRERADWRALFLIAWALPAWLLFEATATKLPHYTLPLYPALALAAGAYATAKRHNETVSAFQKIGAVVFAVIGAAMAAGMGLLPGLKIASAGPLVLLTILGVFFFAGVAIAARAYWRGANTVGALQASALSAIFAWVYLSVLAPGLAPVTLSTDIANAVEREVEAENGEVILSGYHEPSAVFLIGTHTKLARGGEAARLAAAAGPGARLVLARNERAAFDEAAAALDLALEPITTLEGVNYSNGKSLILDIYEIR